MTGTIKKLISERNFGFIRAENGQEVFFHASAVAQSGFACMSGSSKWRMSGNTFFTGSHTEKRPKSS
ncbi:MAG: cold shock domain-containing protein [Acidobacteria bacterium]|nr:cold shock domain-containing protein [Acidobacteriota bacterium]